MQQSFVAFNLRGANPGLPTVENTVKTTITISKDTIMTNTVVTNVGSSLSTNPDSLEILDKINGMYDQALTQILIIVSLTMAFFGIAIPMLMVWYQQKIAKVEEAKILALLSNQNNEFQKDLSASVAKQVQSYGSIIDKSKLETLETLRAELTAAKEALIRRIALSHASAYHLEGALHLSQNKYDAAIHSYCYSVVNHLESDYHSEAQKAINLILQHLPLLDKLNMEDTGLNLPSALEAAIDSLQKHNVRGVFQHQINEIRRLQGAAQSRTRTQ